MEVGWGGGQGHLKLDGKSTAGETGGEGPGPVFSQSHCWKRRRRRSVCHDACDACASSCALSSFSCASSYPSPLLVLPCQAPRDSQEACKGQGVGMERGGGLGGGILDILGWAQDGGAHMEGKLDSHVGAQEDREGGPEEEEKLD